MQQEIVYICTAGKHTYTIFSGKKTLYKVVYKEVYQFNSV